MLCLRCALFADKHKGRSSAQIYRQATRSGGLCVSKACYFILPTADTRCELLKVVPRMKPQDLMPSSTFHGPYKQQKYGHRQSLDGDPGLFHCMHTS